MKKKEQGVKEGTGMEEKCRQGKTLIAREKEKDMEKLARHGELWMRIMFRGGSGIILCGSRCTFFLGGRDVLVSDVRKFLDEFYDLSVLVWERYPDTGYGGYIKSLPSNRAKTMEEIRRYRYDLIFADRIPKRKQKIESWTEIIRKEIEALKKEADNLGGDKGAKNDQQTEK